MAKLTDDVDRRRPSTETMSDGPTEEDWDAARPPATKAAEGNEHDTSADAALASANRSSKRGKIGRRACDGCKVRKIRCSELPPCDRCVKVGIACTFNHVQALRGPRSLREKTIRKIKTVQEAPSAQQQQQQQSANESTASISPVQQDFPPIPVSTLVYLLCTYRLRLFSVWPIVAVEEVMAELHRDPEDLSIYALANAIAAATVAQLKLDGDGQTPSSATLEAEARRTRRAIIDRQGHDEDSSLTSLDALRTTFFLHIFHENQKPGGAKSLLYLRDAITTAQMMRLHDEASYSGINGTEQMIRRRILWLLFVTERGVAVLHGLPVVLNPSPNARFPSLSDSGYQDRDQIQDQIQDRDRDRDRDRDYKLRGGTEDKDDEAQILPAFRKLIELFWIFDRSGAFEMLVESGGSNFSIRPLGTANDPTDAVSDVPESAAPEANSNKLQRCFALLRQHQLQEDHQQAIISPNCPGSDAVGDVQKADVLVTQLWMQAVLWKLLLRRRPQHRQPEALVHTQPLQIAIDLIRIVDHLPASALESHGPTMELKIFDIASSVVDQLSMTGSGGAAAWASSDGNANDILSQLQRVLGGCRGGNPKLLALLGDKIEGLKGASSQDPFVLDHSPGLRQTSRAGTVFESPAPPLSHAQVLSYQDNLEPRVREAFDSLRTQLYHPAGQDLDMTQVSAGDMLLGMSNDVEGLQVPIDGMVGSGAALFVELASNGSYVWDGSLSSDRIGMWPAGLPN